MEWHPDRNKDNIVEATEEMQKINAAYEILRDSDSRRIYDQFIDR